MSYDFRLDQEEADLWKKRNNEYDCEPPPKRPTRIHPQQQQTRRRIPKRYSDIVGSSSTKLLLPRKDSVSRVKPAVRSSTHLPRHHSLKARNPTHHSSKKPSRPLKENQPKKANDTLAHRMQAAMSSELMHSLDRNFVFGDRKQSTNHLLMTRSHSFNICTSWNDQVEQKSSPYFIPRVNIDFSEGNPLSDEPTPDYEEEEEEEVDLQTILNPTDSNDEPIVDYEESRTLIKHLSNGKSATQSDIGLSSSFLVAQVSTTTSEESIPTPPPLPDLNLGPKQITVRCRTIAEKLSSDHQLILKDEQKKLDQSKSSKSHDDRITKDVIFRKTSPSSAVTFSPVNDHQTEATTLCARTTITDERVADRPSSSSSPTSISNEYDQHSSSSKIYNDYKKRTSLSNPSIIDHPMHTRIGLRSSTSSSSITNDKLSDMTLPGKQMNVCVINQLNEHLSTRFRKQQQSSSNQNTDPQSYDPPPEYTTNKNSYQHNQSNVYDEPNDVPMTNTIASSAIPPAPPPPPPPLPAGGFPPIFPLTNRPLNLHRTSVITSVREANNCDLPPASVGSSTISSNLSDTRILCELRENPLFTRAKQHLEIESGSNGRRSGRRLTGSTSNLAKSTLSNSTKMNGTLSYVRVDDCTSMHLKESLKPSTSKHLETIIMHSEELNSLLGKRTRSSIDISQVKSRSPPKPFLQTPCRQSELELIFQKRAQRSEQNPT